VGPPGFRRDEVASTGRKDSRPGRQADKRRSSESHGSDYAHACAECLLSFSCRTGWWLSRKWRGGFQTQIDELKGTNRDSAPTREKILERIQSELNMVNQYLDDLKDGLRMHPGEWVGTYIAKAEALIELLEIHDCGSLGGFDTDGDPMHGLLYPRRTL